MKKVYKSKIGLELVIPLVLVFGTVLFLTISQEPSWIGIAILLPVILFVVHMFVTTNYTIDSDKLTIKCGVLYNKTIGIKTIKKITETNNLLSSPATSLDRLEINYGKFDTVIISPQTKERVCKWPNDIEHGHSSQMEKRKVKCVITLNNRTPATNIVLAIVGLTVINSTFVILLGICANLSWRFSNAPPSPIRSRHTALQRNTPQMTTKRYDILLDDKIVGTTELEKADAAMGVVFGKVTFDRIISGYDFLKTYCLTNNIEIVTDYPDDKLIATADISNLKVLKPNGIEIKGQGTSISGMDNDFFEIAILGISYPFFEEEFPHHVRAYNDQFKGS